MKLNELRDEAPTTDSNVTAVVPPSLASTPRIHTPGTRKNPLEARLLRKRPLSAPGSSKETLHVELALDPLLAYVPGDSLGVFCENDPALAADVLHAMKARAAAA